MIPRGWKRSVALGGSKTGFRLLNNTIRKRSREVGYRRPRGLRSAPTPGFGTSKVVGGRDGPGAVPPVRERGLVAAVRDLLHLFVGEGDSSALEHLDDGTRAFLGGTK